MDFPALKPNFIGHKSQAACIPLVSLLLMISRMWGPPFPLLIVTIQRQEKISFLGQTLHVPVTATQLSSTDTGDGTMWSIYLAQSKKYFGRTLVFPIHLVE